MSDYFRQNAKPMTFDSNSWCILSEIEQSIKRKIEAVGTPLKDWNIKIYRGVLTGCNEAFIIDGTKRDEILANCQSEEERKRTADLIRPILRGKDIKKYKANFADKWLIASHNGTATENRIDINNFPAVKKHLDEHWDKIQKRADQGDTPYNLRSCAYMDDFSKQVICWQRITQEPRFFMTNGDYVILDSMAFLSHIPKKYLNWLLAVLNSDLIYYWVKINVHEYGDTGFRLSNQYVEQISIPKPENKILEEIDSLVGKLIHNEDEYAYSKIQDIIFNIFDISKAELAVVNERVTKL